MTSAEALQTLGLQNNYTEEELKKAYKRLAKKYHPDVAGADATDKFLKIKSAYDLLSISGLNGGKNLLTHQSIFTIVKQR